MQLNVFNGYTYTLETVIQAGQKNLDIVSVPIQINGGDSRPSRLVKSVPSYVWRSLTTILRIFAIYRPMRFFSTIAVLPIAGGTLLCVRWLALYLLSDPSRARAPSLILAAILLVIGALLIALGLIGDQLAVLRRLLEDVQLRLRRIELDSMGDPGKRS